MNPEPSIHWITDRLLCPAEFLDRLKRSFPGAPLPSETSETGSSGTSLCPGQFFAGHTVLELIGRGGMGEVWKAEEDFTSRTVALKVMHPRLLEGRTPGDHLTALRRFRNEMETAARLAHRNLVPLFQAGEDEGRLYYTMEFVQGTSVLETVRKPGCGAAVESSAGNHDDPASGTEHSCRRLVSSTSSVKLQDRTGAWLLVAKYMEEAARGVAHAHRAGYIHRDLKPDNILVDQSADEARVTDFGLAKALSTKDDVQRIMGEYCAGSRGYMAPEQTQDAAQATVQSDIYSLGATLCALLTGLPPTRPARMNERMTDVAEDAPAKLPRDLAAICVKCLQDDAQRRYATAHDLADDLSRFRELRPVSARPLSRVKRLLYWCRRRPAIAALTFVSCAFGLGLLVGIPLAALTLTAARYETRLEREQKESAGLRAQMAEVEVRQERANVALQQARTARERGAWAEVLVHLDRAQAAGYPDPTLISIEVAKAWRASGNISGWTEQVEALSQWQAHERHGGTVLLLMAQLQRFRGNQEESAILTRASLEYLLDPADELYARACVAETTGEAIALLREAVRRDSYHYEATMMLVAGLQLSGARAEAREYGGYARKLFPDDGGFPVWLALIAASESDRERMEHWLEEARPNLTPTTQELLFTVVSQYYSLVEPFNRLDLSDRAWTARGFFGLFQLATSLRRLHHEAGQTGSSLASATRCLPPSFHRAYRPLFELWTLRSLLTGDYSAQIQALDAASRTHEEATLHFLRATLLGGDDRYAEAEEAFFNAAEVPAMIPGIQREALLGAAATANLLYHETADQNALLRAVDHVRRRVELGPSTPFSADLLLQIAMQAKEYDLSRTVIRQVLQSDPHNLLYWTHLAQVELQDQKYFSAMEAADVILSAEPMHQEAQRVKALAVESAKAFLEHAGGG